MYQALHSARRIVVDLGQHAMHPGRWIEQQFRRPRLVHEARREHGLEGVAVGPVSEVVQHRRGKGDTCGVVVHAIVWWDVPRESANTLQISLHHEGRPECVGEPAVLRPGERERSGTEATDPAQALDLRRVEQANDDRLDISLEGDQTVHRVPQNHRR